MRYYGLDGMRGVAAFFVLIHHAPQFFGGYSPPLADSAVDFFFALSGFVLASAYEPRLASGLRFKDLLVVRLVRLYPLYLLGTFLGIAALLGSLFIHETVSEFHLAFLKSIPFAMFLLPSPSFGILGNLFPLDVPAWSLFLELLINIIYFATWRWWRTPYLAVWCAACGILICALPVDLAGGWNHASFWDGPLRVAFSFPVGVFLFRIHTWIGITLRLPTSIILLGFICVIAMGQEQQRLFAILFLYPLFVLIGAHVNPEGKMRVASDWLGRMSYGLYCLHFPIIVLITALLLKLNIYISSPWAVLAVALILLISVLAEKTFDLPVRRALTAALSKERAPVRA